MATFTSFFPGGKTPDQYSPALPGFDYMPFFEEIVDLDQATQTSATSTAIKFNLSNGLKLKLTGTGLKFDAGSNPVSGTIKAIEVYLNNGTTKMQTLTGLNIALELFYDAAAAYDPFDMARFLMRGNDTLRGSAGDQDLNGYGGNDRFIGGSGNDFVHGGEGKDTYDGNAGKFDALNFDDAYWTPTAFRGINLNAVTGKVTDPWNNIETFSEFEQFRGTQFADIFKGASIAEEFMGLGGRDRIDGGGGSDTVLYHRDDRRGGTGNVTVNLETGRAIDGFGKVDTLVSIENARTGDGNDKLTGNSGDNYLRAGAGDDILSGKGGDDHLRGDGGSDTFVFNTALNALNNVDFIEDFDVADDTISLENAIFKALGATGTLSAAEFASNTSGLATSADHRIIYERDTGELYYDSNGSGIGGAVLFAILTKNLGLTATDFTIV